MECVRSDSGFTLVELIVVVGIVAILSLVAVPSYLDSLRKARRSDAIASLSRIQLQQAEWRVHNGDYATLEELGWKPGPGNSRQGYYSIRVISRDAVTFTAIAKPVGVQSGDACGEFAVTRYRPVHAGYAGPGCWRH